jgi:hypothetical protein
MLTNGVCWVTIVPGTLLPGFTENADDFVSVLFGRDDAKVVPSTDSPQLEILKFYCGQISCMRVSASLSGIQLSAQAMDVLFPGTHGNHLLLAALTRVNLSEGQRNIL